MGETIAEWKVIKFKVGSGGLTVHVEAKSSTSSSGNPGEILPRRGWVVWR